MINFSSNVYSRLTAGLSFGLLIFSGCSSHENDNAPITTAVSATDDVHVHPTEGPHHGGLIELGNEEYHIEIVHDDDAGTVTAYILDSSAKLPVPISATQLHVNLSHDGQAEQFALAVNPQSSDPPGKSSRFASNEGELVEDLDNDAVAAQIVVEINGKQYRGAIQHGHESDGGSEHGHN